MYLDPPISSALGCTNVKFCKVLKIPFKVSENERLVKKSFVWLPWQLFDYLVLFSNNCQNVYEKLVISKCFQKQQISSCQNKNFCNDSSILVLFKKVIFKWVGVPHLWEGQVENRA